MIIFSPPTFDVKTDATYYSGRTAKFKYTYKLYNAVTT